MKITNLLKELKEGKEEFVGDTIHISGNLLSLSENSLLFISNLNFHDCIFTGTHLEFENIDRPEFYLGFFDCTFEISIEIKNCNLKRLGFRDVKSKKAIHISVGHFSNLFFRNNNLDAKNANKLTGNVSICNLKVDERIELDFLNHDSDFEFSNNILCDSEEESKGITFENSTFENARFRENNFFVEAKFTEMEIKQSCLFEDCEFDKVNFSNLILGEIKFLDCKFFKTTVFHYISGDNVSSIYFESCLFEKYIQFNGTNSSKFGIDNVEFKKIVSFQETEFYEISIDRTIFEKGALFDDIQIKNIDECDRRTIRIIKRELANSHNQIDYLRFKAYELNAYKKEVDKDKLSWKDSLILYFNESSNYFGLDWTKGIGFIFQWSFIFYLFYIISYAARVDEISKLTDHDYFLNYLKFLNPFSFLKSPIEDSENYLLPFLFFLIGKIFVSYGIYQTIQAFRKFGVNGG